MRNILKNRKIVVFFMLLLTMVMGILVAYAAEVSVDTFDQGVVNISVLVGQEQQTLVNSGLTTLNAIGGERDSVLDLVAGEFDEIVLRIDYLNSNRLAYTSGDGMSGIATITWDGADGNALSTNYTGLNSADLTNGGSNDAFHLQIPFDDLKAKVRIEVYTDSTNWSYTEIILPGGIISNSHVDFTLPFSAFTLGNGAGATFSNVGAIVMILDGTLSLGSDVTVDYLEADPGRDYGDAPDTYCTTKNSTAINCGPGSGARHITDGLRFGRNVDIDEVDGQPTVLADGDDIAQAPDEDGVVFPAGPWDVATGGDVNITVNGCLDAETSGFCYASGWVDWGKDGFFDASDRIFSDYSFSQVNSTQLINFPVPNNVHFSGTDYYMRFRVCHNQNECNTPIGEVTGGEVEDYVKDFTPTAVNLESFTPAANSTLPVIGFVGFLALAIVSLGAIIVRREQKHA